MVLVPLSFILCAFLTLSGPNGGPSIVIAKIYMVVMEDDPVISYKTSQSHVMSSNDVQKYKEKVISRHDMFLQSVLPIGSYTKLYSYTHLLNGFALHSDSDEAVEILNGARGVRMIHEDIKMTKMTTHTPEYMGISTGVWTALGGADKSGEGVVIGLIDTGVNPKHPSFNSGRFRHETKPKNFNGICQAGAKFPTSACNAKIVGAQLFARAAMASGNCNTSYTTSDCASPFDTDGHGSHTASIAAGYHQTPVISKGFNYGNASGIAPGAKVAIYKAVYSFGGYMSDAVAAVDKAVEDGVHILSLSIGPSLVPRGQASFLNILEIELLFATRAGVLVVQAVGNGGPASSSIVSFSPWITSVAASTTDRVYRSSIVLGNGTVLPGSGLSPSTTNKETLPIALAADVSVRNSSVLWLPNCQDPSLFVPSLARGKLIICAYISRFIYAFTNIATIVDTIRSIGAAGAIVTTDRDLQDTESGVESTMTLPVPGIIFRSTEASQALLDYYNSKTIRDKDGHVISFGATGRISDGRKAVYTGKGPIVASYSARGPDLNNNLMETADVLKPNIMAPGSAIWGAWSPTSHVVQEVTGEEFAMLSGTSMATPHIAGVAALIKQKHPDWSPAAITSAMMTTADTADHMGNRLLAQGSDELLPANPFDYGAGAVNAKRALDPGLIFDVQFLNYVEFLCAVPGVDEDSVRRAVGISCPAVRMQWCSDLNTASVTIANLVGSRRVVRRATSVGKEAETYRVAVQEPAGVVVAVTPRVFTVDPNAKVEVRITLEAREARNTFSFGQLVLTGDKKHVVRIPLVVYPGSSLKK